MDWYLDGDDRAALTALRREVAAYLRRHAEPGAEIHDAELVVEELVGNAVLHAGGSIWVTVAWPDVSPQLTVRDLGPGLDPGLLDRLGERPVSVVDAGLHDSDDPEAAEHFFAFAERGRGLFLVSHLAPALETAAASGGGTRVSVELPVKRPPAPDHDPPRRASHALPRLEEARPEGGFGRESFLRALVVQLAAAVELQHGPDAAEAAVAQVGVDVGGQMEEEYRLARDVTGQMGPDQLADCYVRLKHAIDGGFYVVSATADRVVLGNRRCPFGDAVRAAPSLCRMTSAVFGGIAARNSAHGAEVTLEERIAVGDPGCRVVVDLRPSEAGSRPHAHRYAAPV